MLVRAMEGSAFASSVDMGRDELLACHFHEVWCVAFVVANDHSGLN
jgi:hypothetical protein